MSPNGHIDRIDLNQRDISEQAADVADVDPIDRPLPSKPLRSQRRTSRLCGTELPQKITSATSSSVTVRLYKPCTTTAAMR